MNEFVVREDTVKCILYTAADCLLAVFFMIVTAQGFAFGKYFTAFIGITGLWFSIKFMLKYGRILMKRKPVCVFEDAGIRIDSEDLFFPYAEIKEIYLYKKWNSIQILIGSPKVEHPSGYYYVGIVYLYKRGELKEIERKIVEILQRKKVKFEQK